MLLYMLSASQSLVHRFCDFQSCWRASSITGSHQNEQQMLVMSASTICCPPEPPGNGPHLCRCT